MNRLFVTLDADNAGSKVGQAVLMDDVAALHEVSKKIDAGTKAVKDMILSIGGQVISAGGDELTAFIDPVYADRIDAMRARYLEISGFTASMGSGYTLSQAGKSLIAAKLSGKDRHLQYSDEVEDILEEAHQANMAGTADPEQQKMDEHYLSDTMGYEDESGEMLPEDEYEQEDFQPDDEEMYEENQGDDLHSLMQDPSAQDEDFEDGMEAETEEPADDFESEESMDLPVSQEAEMNMEGQDTEKADEQEFFSEEVLDADAPSAEDDQEMTEGAPEDLESDLADEDFNEDILQRVAANLDMFKQNKELMDQIKESNPELYSSILNLIQNMIEMAKMISPSVAGGPGEMLPEEEMQQEAPQMQMSEGPILDPKQ